MTQANIILAAIVGIELIGAGALVGWRSSQPVPPRPVLLRPDPVTAGELEQLRERAHSSSVEDWQELAEAWLAWGYMAEAEVAFKRAAELDDDSFDIAYGWAYTLQRLGRLEDAIAQFERAETLAPEGMKRTCRYHIGRCWLRAENAEEARAAFSRVAGFPPATVQLAKLEIRSGQIEEGLARLAELPEEIRDNVQPVMLRMYAERDRGNADAAGDYSDRVERTVASFSADDTFEFLDPIRLRYGLNRIVTQCDQQATEDSPGQLADCLGAAVKTMDFWYARRLLSTVADLELDQGNADEALRLLDAQIEHSNVTPEVLELRGDALAMKGQIEEAREYWERGAAMRGTESTYASLADEAGRRGDTEAEKRYMAFGYTEAGRKAYRKNEIDNAIGSLSEAVTIAPDHAEAWYYLGLCRAARGERSRAQDAYERCLMAAPNHGRAAEHLERLSRRP